MQYCYCIYLENTTLTVMTAKTDYKLTLFALKKSVIFNTLQEVIEDEVILLLDVEQKLLYVSNQEYYEIDEIVEIKPKEGEQS